jgi:hypothetical protein
MTKHEGSSLAPAHVVIVSGRQKWEVRDVRKWTEVRGQKSASAVSRRWSEVRGEKNDEARMTKDEGMTKHNGALLLLLMLIILIKGLRADVRGQRSD